jgi:YD repeat-containing protein
VDYRSYTWEYAAIPIQEPDGTSWSLSALTGIVTPFSKIECSPNPEEARVNGYTVLSWPTIQVTDAADNTSTFSYNGRHQLTGAQYANGLTVANSYGSDGFLQKSIALQAQATNTYVIQNGELASRTAPLGLTLNFTHDLLGRLTGVGFPDGTTLSNVFNRLDVVAAKDRLGHWSYATYDDMRQLQTLTDRNGGTTLFSYCNCGGLAQVVDPVGNTNTYLRDYLGRVTSIVSAAGSLAIERDNLGQPFHISSTWDLEQWLGHNYQGLVTGVTNPAGTALSVLYDEHDLPVSVTDGAGVTITNQFDGLGRLTSRYNALGQVEYNEYAAQGLSYHYDGLWKLTSYGYDDAGRLSAISNPNQEVTQFGYDVPHRRVSLTDGRNHTKWWGFDIYGLQVAETNANSVLVKTKHDGRMDCGQGPHHLQPRQQR